MGIFGGSGIKAPKMVRIRPGSFLMGSPEDEPYRDSREGPQHEVRIEYDFEVGKYPVTFAEWAAAAAEGACDGYRPHDGRPGEHWGRGKRPVINVSWDHAQGYIAWLNERTGKTYRLLSEAEWEYCCRAGTKTAYSFGDSIRWPQANFLNERTEPVTRFPRNAFGLVGMHGNVDEWCEDCWNKNYDQPGRPDDGSAWLTGDCSLRVLRGGSRNLFSGLPAFGIPRQVQSS